MVLVVAFVSFWMWVVWKAYFLFAYRPRKVAGDVVLITGGGSGLGRQMALRFAKLGASLVLWDVNKEGLQKVAQEVTALGATVRTNVVDVTNRVLVYDTAKQVGDVDILVNNAGIVTGKTVLDCPDHMMEKTVQVNTISHFWTIKAFLPAMLAKDKGHIVTIASAAGLNGVAGLLDYCASKFGAVGTAESLMMELRKKKSSVRSTVVCPYYINTGMFDGAKSRFPFLFPILDENEVADRIVLAVRRGEEHINMPWIVNSTPLLRMLPTLWFANTLEFLGISESMDDFKGRHAKEQQQGKEASSKGSITPRSKKE
jgi:all-trans-retinol dehydrogenase (NAD+)